MIIAIEGATTVNDVVSQYPETVRAFAAFGIDTCCGGNLPVSVAAAKHGVDLAELIAMLGSAINTDTQHSPAGDSCDLARSAVQRAADVP